MCYVRIVPLFSVSLLNEKLSIPITCKIRVFDDLDKTLEYAKMLEKAGCQVMFKHYSQKFCMQAVLDF